MLLKIGLIKRNGEKLWYFLKSTSENSTRIPETMPCGSKLRRKTVDVANLFNQYFSD